jgi:murein DD-endopeptidase MepM/ murein hydrolase activator NlpD
VVIAGWYGPYGNLVAVDHGGGLATVYAHLAGFVVSEGLQAERGSLLGYAGATGRSFGPHLHFEVRAHGTPVDPLAYLPRPPRGQPGGSR